jgi:hypothetical protein
MIIPVILAVNKAGTGGMKAVHCKGEQDNPVGTLFSAQ